MTIYTTGTVSVTAGSAIVTGSGTAWNLSLVQGGLFSCDGLSVPILQVDSDTQLTIAYPWPGTTGSGKVYAIDRQSAAAASAIEANDRLALIVSKLLVSPYLDQAVSGPDTLLYGSAADEVSETAFTAAARALVNLAGPAAANKLPFLNSDAGAALTDLTAFARTLLDDENQAAALGTIGAVAKSGDTMTGGLQFNSPNGDKMALFGTLNDAAAYALGIESSALYYRASGVHRWYAGTVADGGASRIMQASAAHFLAPSIYSATTATSPNVTVSSIGQLLRFTSSAGYKTDIEPLDISFSLGIMDIEPIWYRSLCDADDPDWSWWGFIAEDVAEIDPRLVYWGYREEDYEIRTVSVDAGDAGRPAVVDPETGKVIEEAVPPRPPYVEKEKVLKEGAVLRAEGVAYDRFVVHHHALIRELRQTVSDQAAAIEDLRARLDALEAQS